ncbi:MAG: hypothetical protein DRJ49_02860 [Thermoprotei archaeon]|nr:MAG: hypothetical protein DRJ49_02860 [Thermoprotei archaeon]
MKNIQDFLKVKRDKLITHFKYEMKESTIESPNIRISVRTMETMPLSSISRICRMENTVDKIVDLYFSWRRKLDNPILDYLNHVEAGWRVYERVVFSADDVPIKLMLESRVKHLNREIREIVKSILHGYNFASIIDLVYRYYIGLRDLDIVRLLLLGRGTCRDLLNILKSISISDAVRYAPTCFSMMIIQNISIDSVLDEVLEILKLHIDSIDTAILGGFSELIHELKSRFSDITGEEIQVRERYFLYTFSEYILREIKDYLSVRTLENLARKKRLAFYLRTVHYYRDCDLLVPILFSSKFPRLIALMVLSKYSRVVLPTTYLGPCCSSISSEELQKELDGTINLAILFSDLNESFLNSLWDMYHDVYEYNIASNPTKINFIAVKLGWLFTIGDRLATNRLITMNTHGEIREITLRAPIEVDSCLVLGLNPMCERSTHRELSKYLRGLRVLRLNPYEATSRVESKLSTHRLIERYCKDITMPEYVAILKGTDMRGIVECLKPLVNMSETIVVKPDHSTEGIGVRVFKTSPSSIREGSPIVQYIQLLTEYDDVIVEKFRGNVKYKDEYLSLRLISSWNGRNFCMESGFALVSKHPITSMIHGGRPIPLHVALDNLYYDQTLRRVKLSHKRSDIASILSDVCSKVGRAINYGLSERSMLKFMGIDIVLEYQSGEIVPILLEVNPRPSGLNYLYTVEGEANVFKSLLHYVTQELMYCFSTG